MSFTESLQQAAEIGSLSILNFLPREACMLYMVFLKFMLMGLRV